MSNSESPHVFTPRWVISRKTTIFIAVCSALPVESREKLIVEQIMPVVKELPFDANLHVKIALADVIMGIAPLLGEQNTITYLLPLFLMLLRDDTPEARLNIISSLDKVIMICLHIQWVLKGDNGP